MEMPLDTPKDAVTEPAAEKGPTTPAQLAIRAILLLLLLGGGDVVYHKWFLPEWARGRETRCKSNLYNVNTAIEMYSTDYEDAYPPTLDFLTPTYLHSLPCCPSSGCKYQYVCRGELKAQEFIVYCNGHSHAAAGSLPNFPQYGNFGRLAPTNASRK